MAIRTVVTRGYGNGTFNGTIGLVVTRGYAIGVQVGVDAPFEERLVVRPEAGQLLGAGFSNYIQGQGAELLPSLARISVPQFESDASGGYGENHDVAFLNVPCRLRQSSGGESGIGGGRRAVRTYTMTIPSDQFIEPSSKVFIDGVEYAVETVRPYESISSVKRIVLRRV